MKREEKTSNSIMKIICSCIIMILISGITVMAVNTNMKDIKIVLQNGYEMKTLTNKLTVKEVLAENNILLEENQKTVPDLESEVQEGQTIKITDKSYNEVQIASISNQGVDTTIEQLLKGYAPITEKIVTEQVVIPYETITKNVAGDNEKDTRNKVLKQGKDGLKEVTYKVKYQNDVEIEKIALSEVIISEPVNKIVQVQKKVTTSRAATGPRTTYGGGKWSYSASEFDLLCAITAQECGSSYNGALAVITTACNRAESPRWRKNGSDPLSQYKAKGQFCYSIDNHWRRKLNGNYPAHVKQAVTDALNGARNHNYLSFRAAGTHSGTYIGGNVFF